MPLVFIVVTICLQLPCGASKAKYRWRKEWPYALPRIHDSIRFLRSSVLRFAHVNGCRIGMHRRATSQEKLSHFN